MSAISQKSISGITSITTPAGADNQFTLHNNNTTEAVKLDIAGNLHINNQSSIAGVTTFASDVYLADNKKIYFGNSQDLYITHDSANVNYIISPTSRQLQYKSDGGLLIRGTGNQMIANFLQSAVTLYQGQQIKLTTVDKGITVGTGVTIETNGQATYTGIVTATAFKLANGSDVGTGAGGTWSSYTAGIATSKSVGVNTSTLDDNDLVGVGNSFQGLYISNGMMITDNSLHGNHYIGTAFNGLMAGPVNIEGTLTIDGNYVVV